MDPSSIKLCQLCSFKAPDLKYLLKHIRQVHAHKPGFQIVCGLSSCPKRFGNFEVFRNHVYDFHTNHETVVPQTSSLSNEEELCNESPENENSYEECSHSKKIRVATWILKVQETYKLPQSTMESILKDTTGLIQDLLIDIRDDVESCLTNAGVNFSNVSGLSELFDSSSLYANPFSGLDNQYSQLKFYKDKLNLVVCYYFCFYQY